MKYLFLSIFMLTVALPCTSSSQTSESPYKADFNLESAQEYFRLVNKAKLGMKISSSEYKEFLELKGNRLFISENNISQSTLNKIKDEIELVYNPKNDSILESRIHNDIRLEIRKRYREYEEVYIKHLKEIDSNKDAYRNDILKLTRDYLPKRMHKLDSFPNIYLHALWDGSASDEGIFVDIILAYDFDQKSKGSFISHELHHFMSSSLINLENVEESDKGLIWAIESIMCEGLADMIDKSALIFTGSDWWLNEHYMAFLNYAEDVISEMDNAIQKEAKGMHLNQSKYRELLYNSVGHIPGQYMCQKIKEAGRLHELIENLDNPFILFEVYNEIAIMDHEIVAFSTESIQYLDRLNKKYIAQGR